MFGLSETCKGFRLARFSGENRKEVSENFFLGPVPNKNEFPTSEEQCAGTPKGYSARCRRLSGLGWLVDLGRRWTGVWSNGAAADEIVFRRQSVIVSWNAACKIQGVSKEISPKDSKTTGDVSRNGGAVSCHTKVKQPIRSTGMTAADKNRWRW
jgi:hypothetical protein